MNFLRSDDSATAVTEPLLFSDAEDGDNTAMASVHLSCINDDDDEGSDGSEGDRHDSGGGARAGLRRFRHFCCDDDDGDGRRCFTLYLAPPLLVALLFILAGSVLSALAASSCDLADVKWTGSSSYIVSKIGPFRYYHARRNACLSYSADAAETEGFFPPDEPVRVFAVLAPVFGGTSYFLLLGLAFARPDRAPHFLLAWLPWTACVFQGLTFLLLRDNRGSDNDRDIFVCNRTYSVCRVGPGGGLAIGAMVCFALAGGAVLCGAAMDRRSGRQVRGSIDREASLEALSERLVS